MIPARDHCTVDKMFDRSDGDYPSSLGLTQTADAYDYSTYAALWNLESAIILALQQLKPTCRRDSKVEKITGCRMRNSGVQYRICWNETVVNETEDSHWLTQSDNIRNGRIRREDSWEGLEPGECLNVVRQFWDAWHGETGANR